MSDTALLNEALAGRYDVEREVGAGGMATVYVARDVRHDRKVALKVLRPELSAILGGERFLKEIRTTANLQHPHILPLHDSGNANGLIFYVMPFVEGESLRDRLNREKQLAVDDAVRIAKEVASALDYAHRHGVIHRDIKPENILLHDGQALVADFGIALAASAISGGTRMTETGMSLGTPHYMSPEQAMGEREITARSDVYALGCVLYEMLLGEPPFTGPTAQAIIARVVTEEPRSLTLQRKTIPPHVEAAVWTALAKLPADRFASAAEFGAALSAPSYTGAHTRALSAAAPATHRKWLTDPRTLATMCVAAAAVLAAIFLSPRKQSGSSESATTRFVVPVTDTSFGLTTIGNPTTSPDGSVLAFSLRHPDTSMVYIQSLDRFEQRTIPGGGRSPFFSPDGKQVGFVRGTSVWKVPVDGGDPVRVGNLDTPVWYMFGSGVWHPNGQMYFATLKGLLAIPAAGGDSRVVMATDSASGTIFTNPLLMPDGRLMGSINASSGPTKIGVVDIGASNPRPTALDFGVEGTFVGGIILFRRQEQIFASRFDSKGLKLVGEPIVLAEPRGVTSAASPTVAWFGAGVTRKLEPVWVTRDGKITPTGLPITNYRWPRVSRDGRRIALLQGSDPFISVWEPASGGKVALTATDGNGTGRTEPVWYHDGRRVLTSASSRQNRLGLVSQVADASQPPDTVALPAAGDMWPTDISPGDTLVLYYGSDGRDPDDIYVYNLARKTSRRIALPGDQRGARFSPNGKWIAIESAENGRREVVVQPWPALNARYVVSTVADGGDHPVWSTDGKELFFRSGDRMMSVKVAAGDVWVPSEPVMLFRGQYARDRYGDQSFDVAPDGRFLMLRDVSDGKPQIFVIRNWLQELEKKLGR